MLIWWLSLAVVQYTLVTWIMTNSLMSVDVLVISRLSAKCLTTLSDWHQINNYCPFSYCSVENFHGETSSEIDNYVANTIPLALHSTWVLTHKSCNYLWKLSPSKVSSRWYSIGIHKITPQGTHLGPVISSCTWRLRCILSRMIWWVLLLVWVRWQYFCSTCAKEQRTSNQHIQSSCHLHLQTLDFIDERERSGGIITRLLP